MGRSKKLFEEEQIRLSEEQIARDLKRVTKALYDMGKTINEQQTKITITTSEQGTFKCPHCETNLDICIYFNGIVYNKSVFLGRQCPACNKEIIVTLEQTLSIHI